ncbi:MAG: Ig-like domain-containing protein [Ruminiclostridium sp.]
MKVIKKIIASLLAGVIAVSALCAVAGAESIFDTKTALTSGKKVTISYTTAGPKNYKIKVAKSGTLKINYTVESTDVNFYLYDSEGTSVPAETYSAKSGRLYTNYGDTEVVAQKNSTSGIGSGEITFKVKKGTYYFSAKNVWYGSGKLKLTATFPTSDESSSDAKIDALTLSVKKGTSLSFGTMITGTADLSDIKWTTSDKKVATVSEKGVVKAVAKGSATITAKIGSSSVKIIIKVTA